MENEQPKLICVIETCKKPAQWKGLCGGCYHQAKKVIDLQETTWEELEKLGLCQLPPTPFVAAYRKAKAQ